MSPGRERPLDKPVFIGLTGTIASGKSTVLAELEKLGVPVLSSDAVVHEIYESPELIELIRERFGDDVIRDGAVDRDAVAAEVFAEPESRAWLEQLIWPRVGARIFEFKTEHEAAAEPPRAIVVEVPLLFESGMDQAFDKTVTVTADDAVRHARAQTRGTGVSDLKAREERQMSAVEKAERADFVVDNSGEIGQLAIQLREMLDSLTSAT